MDPTSFAVTVILGVLFSCVNGEMEREKELERRRWNAGLGYSGSNGYHRVGGHVGYSSGGWSVRGSGWIDNMGGSGVGASLSYSWRRGLPMPENIYVLRFEANPCVFGTYDRDEDGIISSTEMHRVLPAAKLAESLLGDLDVNEDGDVDVDEFKKRKGVIKGCAEPKDDKKK